MEELLSYILELRARVSSSEHFLDPPSSTTILLKEVLTKLERIYRNLKGEA